MKDYYKLREILLGLRKEQIRILKELQCLGKMLDSYNKEEYQGSHFFLELREYCRELCYNLKLNYSMCDKVGNLVFNGINLFDFDTMTILLKKRKNGDYYFPNVDIKVLKDKQNEFNQKVDNILKDPFVDSCDNYGISIENSNSIFGNIAAFNYDVASSAYFKGSSCLSEFEGLEGFLYYANDDKMSLYFTKAYFDKNMYDIINKILDIKISRDSFTEYIQNVIDNSNDAKKHIIVPNGKINDYNLDFTLVDRHDTFVLVKK